MENSEFKISREILLKEMKDFRITQNTIENRSIYLEEKQAKDTIKYGNIINQHHVLDNMNRKYAATADMFKNHYDEIDPDDQTGLLRLGLYESTYGKPIHIYLVSDDWINNLILKKTSKKKSSKEIKPVSDDVININDQDDQVDTMTKLIKSTGLVIYKDDMIDVEFKDITISWIKDYILTKDSSYSEQEFYFHLTKKTNLNRENMKYWDTIYFFNDAHYNEFMTIINDMKLSSKSDIKDHLPKELNDIFLAQYNSIENAHKDIASQMAFRAKYPKSE